jgi:hypothetical protein
MRNGSLAQALSASIDRANLVALARPVDAHKSFNLFRHAPALSRITHIRAAATSVIPVLALEAQPPTGLPPRPTCRGVGPLHVLKTRGFLGDSRLRSEAACRPEKSCASYQHHQRNAEHAGDLTPRPLHVNLVFTAPQS